MLKEKTPAYVMKNVRWIAAILASAKAILRLAKIEENRSLKRSVQKLKTTKIFRKLCIPSIKKSNLITLWVSKFLNLNLTLYKSNPELKIQILNWIMKKLWAMNGTCKMSMKRLLDIPHLKRVLLTSEKIRITPIINHFRNLSKEKKYRVWLSLKYCSVS